MRDGFIKVAAITPKIKVADVQHNTEEICRGIAEATKAGARIVVFPELCITGASCGDLFAQHFLIEAAEDALMAIADCSRTAGDDAVIFVGLPMETDGKLYNVTAAIQSGHILALIPKKHFRTDSIDERYFVSGNDAPHPVMIEDDLVPFGTNVIIDASHSVDGLIIGCETGEDYLVTNSPATVLGTVGVTVMVHPDASPERVGDTVYRRDTVAHISARLHCGYIHAAAGEYESVTDTLYAGHNMIAEDGVILAENEPLFGGISDAIVISEIDVRLLCTERLLDSLFSCTSAADDSYHRAVVSFAQTDTTLTRRIAKNPFLPENEKECTLRLRQILTMQTRALSRRLSHISCAHPIVGVSGGLDSALALIVAHEAAQALSLPAKNVLAVSMPCFGSSERTKKNAAKLSKALGAAFSEIDISDAVTVHLDDIGHDLKTHDTTYENAQARERTQILMDLANLKDGLVVGTGDMSELALGWCTYNGDHMAMYGVNASLPKTLVRHLVKYYADTCGKKALSSVLYDILDTPVSPELLPAENGDIAQKTEDILGPYELHDFFLYYVLRRGYEPRKILRLASYAFAGEYKSAEIKTCMKTFYKRFFASQFKRSCMPDGIGVGSVSLSPRGGLHMPSDAAAALWLAEVETL